MEIPNEKIIQVVQDNLGEILKDVLTGYSSPVKQALQEQEFTDQLKEIAKNTLKEVLLDESFSKKLKETVLQKAIENMFDRR